VELADTPPCLGGRESRNASMNVRIVPLLLNTKTKQMSKDRETEVDTTWDAWLNDMSDREQPDVCSVDNPDCEACGS
jgi:hypothetical protein